MKNISFKQILFLFLIFLFFFGDFSLFKKKIKEFFTYIWGIIKKNNRKKGI